MSKKTTKRLNELLNSAADEIEDSGQDPLILQVITPADITKEMSASSEIALTQEEKDFEYARETMVSMTEQSRRAVELMFRVCEETGHPRSFEVLGQLLKVTTDIAKELVGLRKTKAELNKFRLPGDPLLSPSSQPASILDGTQGVVFRGTTTDLLKAIRDAGQSDKE